MAEGWAKKLLEDTVEATSAGIECHGLNPRAIQAMAEAGVDLSGHRSKTLDELAGAEFDLVITVCGDADRRCPAFSGTTRVVHAGFDDPPRLAAGIEDDEEALAPYRRVRDEIRQFIASMPGELL